jgi:hypothetical protein
MHHLSRLALAAIALVAASVTGNGQDAKPALVDKSGGAGAVAGHVFVSGEVKRGGSVDIVAGETLTLTKAILQAGGVGEWGDLNKVLITRLKADLSLEKLTVNLKKIMKSGDAKLDPVLQDRDRIFVPKILIGLE